MVPWAQVPKIFESQTIISLGCIQLKSVTSLASGGTDNRYLRQDFFRAPVWFFFTDL